MIDILLDEEYFKTNRSADLGSKFPDTDFSITIDCSKLYRGTLNNIGYFVSNKPNLKELRLINVSLYTIGVLAESFKNVICNIIYKGSITINSKDHTFNNFIKIIEDHLYEIEKKRKKDMALKYDDNLKYINLVKKCYHSDDDQLTLQVGTEYYLESSGFFRKCNYKAIKRYCPAVKILAIKDSYIKCNSGMPYFIKLIEKGVEIIDVSEDIPSYKIIKYLKRNDLDPNLITKFICAAFEINKSYITLYDYLDFCYKKIDK